MHYKIITAECDLGVHVDGSKKGPKKLIDNIDVNESLITRVIAPNVEKEKTGLEKNLNEVNKFNEKLYNTVDEICKNNFTPITIGGDHSIVIGSALASIKNNDNLGIIWIDAHGDYNTFETTESGNLHGLPFATITGYKNEKLRLFHNGKFYNPKNACLVGVRDLSPDKERDNLIDNNITMFTTEDIKKYGVKEIMKKAIEIASNNTKGIHISYDIDVIDPNIAPGVSIPAKDGINKTEAYEIANIIKENIDKVKSLDIVEYNPDYDINDQTLNITKKIFNIITK